MCYNKRILKKQHWKPCAASVRCVRTGKIANVETKNILDTLTKCRDFLQCLNNYSIVKREPKNAASGKANFSPCGVAAERGPGTPYS